MIYRPHHISIITLSTVLAVVVFGYGFPGKAVPVIVELNKVIAADLFH